MLGLPKPPSRATGKRERLAAKRSHYRLVCVDVSRRDGYRCRSCKTPVMSGAGHHHHVRFRSKGGNDTTSNLVLLCGECHAEIHAYRLAIVGEDANGVLRFVKA